MKKIKQFLKLRKQNDRIKIALLMFILAAFVSVNGIMKIISYYKTVNLPVEYILEAGSLESMTNSINRLKEVENLVAASRQNEFVIALGNDEFSNSLIVTELSDEYLSKCYGISADGTGTQFFLNSTAFSMVSDNSGDSSIQKAYYIDGVKQFAATFKKVDGLDESQPLAFCKGTSLSLSGTSVRVMLEKTDITGKTVEKIQRIGFWVTNNDIVLTAAYEQKITLLQARYSIIILALTVFCGCILLKQVKH